MTLHPARNSRTRSKGGDRTPAGRMCGPAALLVSVVAAVLSLRALALGHRHDPPDHSVLPDLDSPDLDDPDLIAELQDEMTRAVLSTSGVWDRSGAGPSISRAVPDAPNTPTTGSRPVGAR